MDFETKGFGSRAVARGWIAGLLVTLAMLFCWSSAAQAQARVLPRLQCVAPALIDVVSGATGETTQNVELTAYFGYASEWPTPVTIEYGTRNFFSPGTPLRGQPEVFMPGNNPGVFPLTFNSTRTPTLTWNLDGNSAAARNDPALYCSPEVTEVSIPLKGQPGDVIEVTLTGKHFALNSTVNVRSVVPAVPAVVAEVSENTFERIKFRLYISEYAPGGLYTVNVDGPTPNTSFIIGELEVVVPVAISAIVLTPSGALFAGTERDGIFRSTNGGENWVAVNNGLANLRINALVLSGDGSVIFAGTGGGVYRSADNGQSWQLKSEGM